MRILIIEDEKTMARTLKRVVDEKGHMSDIAFTGRDGLERAQGNEYDVIVLDLMLPDIDGFEVAQTLRSRLNRVPILILTARDTVGDMVRALDLGADDYLTKPFALAEFMARLRAISRRGPVLQPSVLHVADITLNPATCEVLRGEVPVVLTRTEYLLLEFLMRRPSRVLSKAAIIAGVWSADKSIGDNTLEAFIKLLRAKIDDGREEKLIQTIPRLWLSLAGRERLMKSLPIRLRLTLWYTGITCLTFLAVALAIYFSIRVTVQRNADRELAMRLEGIRIFLQRNDLGTQQLADKLQEQGGARLNGDPFQVVNQEGQWVYRPASVSSLKLPAEYPQPGSDRYRLFTVESQGKKFRILSGTIRTSGHSYGVQIVSNITPIYSVLSRILWVSLAGIPFILVVAGAGGYWLSSRAMQPVLHITQTAKSIGERNLADRLTVSSAHDELRELTETLNDMLQRLETAFKRITRFTADASHELRTPVAIIRTTAEFILQKERSVPEYQQLVGQILVESEATTEMIEGLLTLARADSQPSSGDFAETDLWMLSAEVIQSIKPLADTKRLALEILPIDRPAPVWARRSDLKKLIVILLDNAIKYTPEGGRIEVSVAHFSDQSFLEAKDTGVGIVEEDIPHIFERFYRADKGRSRETGGIGLGLSIAQAIADDHAAHIVVRSQAHGGSSFRILFPAETPHSKEDSRA